MSELTGTATAVPVPAAIVVPAGTIEEDNKRRNKALFLLGGGGVAMTGLALLAMILLDPSRLDLVFYMGMFAMINILVVFTAIAAVFAKRTLRISKGGIEILDHENK